MKLFFKGLITAVALSSLACSVSFAASYDVDKGQVSVTNADTSLFNDDASMVTVMVTPYGTDLNNLNANDVLYIDQGNELSTFINMGVKGGKLNGGTYTMYIGSDKKEQPRVSYFTIADVDSAQTSAGLDFQTVKSNETTNDYFYVINMDNKSNNMYYGVKFKYNYQSSVYTSAEYYLSPSDIQVNGEASTVFGVRISNVPAEYENFRVEPVITNTEPTEKYNPTATSADNNQ